MKTLKGSQRKYLRGLAHHLDPIVQIGKSGLSENVLGNINQALADHELIKVKFIEFKEDKDEISEKIATDTQSELAGIIGNIAIFYRPHANKEKRKIILPK